MARLFTAASSQTISGSAALTGGAPFNCSMSCWVYANTLPANAVPMGLTNHTLAYNFVIFQISSGNVVFQANGTGSAGNPVATATLAPSTSVWQHYGGSYGFVAGAGGTGTAAAYLNGANKGTATVGGTATPAFNETDIGGYVPGTTDYWDGRIAEAAIWNVVLTDAEFAALATGINAYRVRPSALVGYWPVFGLASPEPDLSGFKNNLTLSNAPTQANHSPTTLWTPRRPALAVSQTVVVTPSADTLGQAIFRVRQPGWQW